MRISKKTFDEAIRDCQTFGPGWTLAVPSTDEDEVCLKQNRERYHPMDQRASVWIGYFDQDSDNWTDIFGNELKKISWGKTKAYSGSSRRCAIFRYTKLKFLQVNCSEERPYMCQKCELSSQFSHDFKLVVCGRTYSER